MGQRISSLNRLPTVKAYNLVFVSSWKKDNERFESMIRSCTCSRGAASNPELAQQRRGSKACKSCGREVAVSGRGAKSRSMVSTVEVELLRAIDPQLTWKTASNGRQRAVRRARTKFPGVNKKNPAAECSKESEDLSCREQKIKGAMAVSESEKLGVSTLGRHFSDTREFVPIKKRRFMLFPSSPPRQSPSHSNDFDHIPENPSASHQETGSNVIQIPEVNSDVRCEQGQDKILANEGAYLNGINEKLHETADFSGIPILAAAACDGNVDCDLSNAIDSVSKGPSSGGKEISRSPGPHSLSTEKADQVPNTSEALDGKVDVPMGRPIASFLPSNESHGNNTEAPLSQGGETSSLLSSHGKVTKIQSFSRCNRSHWDLNTEMDEWEIPLDGVTGFKPLASDNVGVDGIHDGKLVSDRSYESRAPEFVDTRFHMDVVVKNNCASGDSNELEKRTFSYDNLAADHKQGKEDLFAPCKDGLAKEEQLLEDAAVPMEEEKADAHHVMPCEDGFAKEEHGLEGASVAMEEANADAHRVSVGLIVEADMSSSYQTRIENINIERSTHALEQQPTVSENTYSDSVPGVGKGICCFDITQLEGLPQAEKDLCDSETGNISQCLAISNHPEEVSDAAVHRNICNRVMATDGMSTKIVHTDASTETTRDQYDRSEEVATSPQLPDSPPFTSQGSSNHVELSSGSASAGEVVMATDMKDGESNVLPNENMDVTISNHAVCDGLKVFPCSSEAKISDICDGLLPDGALSSHGTCKSSVGSYVCRHDEDNLENQLENDYDSDASQINADCRIGMEKIELSRDDDSQYEDGELRDSAMNSWREYRADEAEIEHVDYGSDCREADVFETAVCPASGSSYVDDVGCNVDGANAYCNGAQVCKKDVRDAVSQSFPQVSSTTDNSDDGSGKRSIGSIMKNITGNKKLERYLEDALESGSGSVDVREVLNDDGAKESGLRMKSSGWDRFLEGRRNSGDGGTHSGIDSANWGRAGAQLDASSSGESMKSIGGPASQRELSSRIEKPDSVSLSCRRDKSFARPSRHSGETKNLSPRVGGDNSTTRSFDRGGPSLHMHGRGRGRGRGDRWPDSSHYWDPKHHDASIYYGPGRFSHCGSRNAVAEAAAKVESNGFVVTPDGTLLKSGRGPAERGHGWSADGFSCSTRHSVTRRDSAVERDGAFGVTLRVRNLREMSPDRDINFDSRTGRYRAGMMRPSLRDQETLHDGIDSQLSIHPASSTRKQSISPPHRRPFHPSRSPSRSRSRSPHTWRYPRGRNGHGMNKSPVLCRHTRSPPNFRYGARLERPRSPLRRTGSDRIIGYGPLSLNCTSVPHVSSWIDERDDLPDRIRKHTIRRPSERSPPMRVLSRNNRSDSMDSSGRPRHEEYFRPNRVHRSPDLAGVGRGSRHDRDDDRRGHLDRYGVSRPVRQYDVNGNIRHFRYDVEDVCQGRNSQTKISPEFQRRGSPRGSDRGIEGQHGASPESVREGSSH